MGLKGLIILVVVIISYSAAHFCSNLSWSEHGQDQWHLRGQTQPVMSVLTGTGVQCTSVVLYSAFVAVVESLKPLYTALLFDSTEAHRNVKSESPLLEKSRQFLQRLCRHPNKVPTCFCSPVYDIGAY